jgi:hypothetical protein
VAVAAPSAITAGWRAVTAGQQLFQHIPVDILVTTTTTTVTAATVVE